MKSFQEWESAGEIQGCFCSKFLDTVHAEDEGLR